MKKSLRSAFLTGLFIFLLLPLFCGLSHSAEQALPYRFHTEWASLSPEEAQKLDPPTDGKLLAAVLWLTPESGYYTYSHEPGSGGVPLDVAVFSDGSPLPASIAEVRYAEGISKPMPGGGTSLTLEGVVPVFILFHKAPEKELMLEISLLACSSRHCFPIQASVPLAEAPASPLDASSQPWFDALASSIPGQPEPFAVELPSLAPAPASSAPVAQLSSTVSPYAVMLPPASGGITKSITGGANPIALPEPATLHSDYGFEPQLLEGALQIDGWSSAIIIGLIAGLLLNVMPCVLPVLTMKFSILLDNSSSFEERVRDIREHTVFFALGIVAWFALLAFITAFSGMLWGELFQRAEVVFFMLVIVFSMGLSMFGIFHLPVLDLQSGHSSSPRIQAFSTGMFTTLLATPCSGPLLGGVLAWGITKPLPVLVTVFAATGLGMALPYAVLACFPRLVRFLPRPGAWLGVMERILGILLMGTAIYLFSLLPAALHIKTLITLLVAATAAWIWGRWGSLRGTALRRAIIGGLTLGAVLICSFWTFRPVSEERIPWTDFSEERFLSDLGGKAMLVEFTAGWCPTCKVLEQTVLTPSNILPLLKDFSLLPVKVDMTEKNDAQQRLLRGLDSASIPLLAVFPTGKNASRPVILRDIYTLSDIEQALRQAEMP